MQTTTERAPLELTKEEKEEFRLRGYLTAGQINTVRGEMKDRAWTEQDLARESGVAAAAVRGVLDRGQYGRRVYEKFLGAFNRVAPKAVAQ